MAENLLSEIEQLAPRLAQGDADSLDPLRDILRDLLVRTRDLDWLNQDVNGVCGMSITRLVNILPDFAHHCPELYGLLRSSDVSGQSVAAATGILTNSTPFGQKLADWSIATDSVIDCDGSGGKSATGASSGSATFAIRPLVLVLRVIRNLLEGISANQDAFLQCGALDAMATISDRLISSHITQQQQQSSGGPGISSGVSGATVPGTASGRPAGGANASTSSSPSTGNAVVAAAETSALKLNSATPASISASENPVVTAAAQAAAPATASPSATAPPPTAAAHVPPPSARQANRPPAIATKSGANAAALKQRKARSINRGSAGSLSLPLMSPSAGPLAGPGASPSPGALMAPSLGGLMSPAPGGPPMSPMFYSSLLPPASPSVLHLALRLDLPVDHVHALTAVLQVINGFASGGEVHQCAVWDRCFPGTFSRLATVRSPPVQSALSRVLLTCTAGVGKHADGLGGSSDGVALLAGVLRTQAEAITAAAAAAEKSGDEASPAEDHPLGLLVDLLCLQAQFFESIFKNLHNFSPRPALGQVQGLFCPEQGALLWFLWRGLHARAQKQGVPGMGHSPAAVDAAAAAAAVQPAGGFLGITAGSLRFLLTVCKNAAMGLQKAREEAQAKGSAAAAAAAAAAAVAAVAAPPSSSSAAARCMEEVLQYSLCILQVLAACSAQIQDPADDLFSTVGGSEAVPLLLDLLKRQSVRETGVVGELSHGCNVDVVAALAIACRW